MKRSIILSFFIALSLYSMTAIAQKGLNIADAFTSRYRDLPDATETLIAQNVFRDIHITLYHAITITNRPDLASELETMVMHDGAKATSKEASYTSGHLYYGFYALTPRDNINRYILYINGNLRSDNKIILLYLEGKASIDDVKKLINKKN